ncbi:MAG TPA: nucleoside hydrolase [Terriglobales bacterium]|nr:nucleoside hydrolase [Terriglobales bacterium]
MKTKCALLLVLLAAAAAAQDSAGRRKVFIDQDIRGAAGTDQQSILVLLQSPEVQVLGISVTSGDGWARAGVANLLRMLELTGHSDVPVAMGAQFPLINSQEETRQWEAQYGELNYKGAWNERDYIAPDAVPTPAAGAPATRAISQHGAEFLYQVVSKYPGEVTVWAAGPLTTIALAVRLHPELPALAKELVMMGGGINVPDGGIQQPNGRREFNWWFDPEATRIVLSAPWKKITVTPLDISVKTAGSTPRLRDGLAKSNSRAAKYLTQYGYRGSGGSGYMYDEIAAAAWIDPTLITNQQELWINVDINHGASYGQTIFVEKSVKVPSWWKLATVQFDLDTGRFYRLFLDLMQR